MKQSPNTVATQIVKKIKLNLRYSFKELVPPNQNGEFKYWNDVRKEVLNQFKREEILFMVNEIIDDAERRLKIVTDEIP